MAFQGRSLKRTQPFAFNRGWICFQVQISDLNSCRGMLVEVTEMREHALRLFAIMHIAKTCEVSGGSGARAPAAVN